MSKKLYKVYCIGMRVGLVSNVAHGVGYVIADNPDQAYKKLRANLDKEDLGFAQERELEKIKLIAENDNYPDCGFKLYL